MEEIKSIGPQSMFRHANALVQKGRRAEALTALDRFVVRYGDDTSEQVRTLVAKAILNKGTMMSSRRCPPPTDAAWVPVTSVSACCPQSPRSSRSSYENATSPYGWLRRIPISWLVVTRVRQRVPGRPTPSRYGPQPPVIARRPHSRRLPAGSPTT